MKKILQFIVIIFAVFFSTTSCEKEEEEFVPDVIINVHNNTSYPYEIISYKRNGGEEIKCLGFDITPNSSRELTGDEGYYSIKVKQTDGYMLFPTQKELTVTALKGNSYDVFIED